MKASEIYAKAAEELYERGNGWGACEAISACLVRHIASPCTFREDFEKLFVPKNPQRGAYWFGLFTDENHEARILSLCFMAAIAADEERSNKRSPR